MTDPFLYTLPQWFVFTALFMVIYGWIEDKKSFRLLGISTFILLGIFSLVIVLGDYLAFEDYLSPGEIAAEELEDEIVNDVPFEAKLLPGYWSFIVASILAIPALFLDWTNKKHSKVFIVLTALLALLGFFIIVGTIREM